MKMSVNRNITVRHLLASWLTILSALFAFSFSIPSGATSLECSRALGFIGEIVGTKEGAQTVRETPDLRAAIKKLMNTYGITAAEVNQMVADGKPIFTEVEKYTATGRGEIFKILGGLIQIDIPKAYWMIEKKQIIAPLINRGITTYAENAYGLDRKLGWEVNTNITPNDRGGHTIKMGVTINREYAGQIDPTRLNQPGIVLELSPTNSLIIDGNHRAARRYMDGLDTMDFYVIDLKDLDKIKVQ